MTRVEGRFGAASNVTLLGVTADGDRVVYKPVAGERELWDFPTGTLAAREVLTYRLSAALGLSIVPETVIGDGVHGAGAVQRFVEVDEDFDALDLVRGDPAPLWPIAVLDVLANNADRKLGHIVRSRAGDLFALDHGLTFHCDDKLRTVLWLFAGQPLPVALATAVRRLSVHSDALHTDIETMVGPAEAEAFGSRLAAVATGLVHPSPPQDRPALPWPLY